MPELPEVQVIVDMLEESIVGETIEGVAVGWPKSVATHAPDDFSQRLMGQGITGVSRRAKYVVISLSDGYLICHLRMTGRLLVVSDGDCREAPDKHVHVILDLTGGKTLLFRDLRKFGRFYLVDDPDLVLRGLGPEPLSAQFTIDMLQEMMSSHHRLLKPALLDQRFLAGLGNIYVDESLWEAGLHPLRHSDTLSPSEVQRLHGAIRLVLSRAVANRGTTLRDYRNPQNQPGANQYALAVYHRQGEPCGRCGSMIARSVVGGRGTHYCPVCQPAFDGQKEKDQ